MNYEKFAVTKKVLKYWDYIINIIFKVTTQLVDCFLCENNDKIVRWILSNYEILYEHID